MPFSIIVEPGAQLDIEEAYNYYHDNASPTIAELFYNDLQHAYRALIINPFYQFRTKIYRAIPLRKFPFLMFFIIDEQKQIIKVLALFNTNQNSDKYPI